MPRAATTVSGSNTADTIEAPAVMASGNADGPSVDSFASALASTAVALSPPPIARDTRKPAVPPRNKPATPSANDIPFSIYPPFFRPDRIRAAAKTAIEHPVMTNVRSRDR